MGSARKAGLTACAASLVPLQPLDWWCCLFLDSGDNPMTEHLRLISTPQGYECETEWGTFQTAQKWKAKAYVELCEWIRVQRAVDESPCLTTN